MVQFRYYKELEIDLSEILEQLDEMLKTLLKKRDKDMFNLLAGDFLTRIREMIEGYDTEFRDLPEYYKLYKLLEELIV